MFFSRTSTAAATSHSRSKRLQWRVLSILSGGVVLGALSFVSGCGGGGGGDSEPALREPPAQPGWRSVKPVAAQPTKKWTFLVYINGANNLEEYVGLNMNQMEAVGSSEAVNIVVQVKKLANRYDPDFKDWVDTATRRFYILKDEDRSRIGSQLISQKEDVDSGKAETLQEFVQWGTRAFPAERYCLVVWNHGAGWRSVKTPKVAARRGVSYDDQTGSNINTIELPAAIDMGSNGRKWDLLAWDSSLMQMAEVAYEVRDKADYIVGSEESPPGEGYPYDRFLAKLVQNPDMDGRELGFVIADDTLATNGLDSEVTQSVLDAAKMEDIAPAVDALGAALLSAKAEYATQIAFARDVSENYSYPQNSDLLDFCRLLREPAPGSSGASTSARVPDARVQAAVAQVEAAVRAAVLKNVTGAPHRRSQGLAIFLPTPGGYALTDEAQTDGFGQRYGLLAFTAAAPNWQRFLIEGPP